MRWISLCTVLSAALLPAVGARPLCRPDTSTSLTTTPAAETTTPGISSTTPVVETPTSEISSTTPAAETPTSDISSTTPAAGTPTSEISSSTPTPTPATTTPSSTPTPTPENLILNGDFEEDDLSVWGQRTVTIEEDASKAHSPDHYARFYVNNHVASGGNQLNQTINGLDVARLYRLTFSSAVFGMPQTGGATCALEALQEDTVFKSWTIDTSVIGHYRTYTTDFFVTDEDITLTLRLRCSSQNLVTLDVAVDDLVLNDIGLARL